MHTNVLNPLQKYSSLHDTCYLMNINISSDHPLPCPLLHLTQLQSLKHGFPSLLFLPCLFFHHQTWLASTRKVHLPSLHPLQVISITPLITPLFLASKTQPFTHLLHPIFSLLLCLTLPYHFLLPTLVSLQSFPTLLTLSFPQHLNLPTAFTAWPPDQWTKSSNPSNSTPYPNIPFPKPLSQQVLVRLSLNLIGVLPCLMSLLLLWNMAPRTWFYLPQIVNQWVASGYSA